ncbi:MAG TPA: type II toxin-antitoxin system prevent-host-death family antitoxin [Acidimicrobiales bacterium]|nr:type II toxin-antitoxin system prevent-host-death family antitoxin [Acidimicrobiales bacterium]
MTKSASQRVGVHEAKTRLSQLLRIVEAGGEIEILRNGVPVARLVASTPARRSFGAGRGEFVVPEDFDEPLTEAELAEWYDEPVFPS